MKATLFLLSLLALSCVCERTCTQPLRAGRDRGGQGHPGAHHLLEWINLAVGIVCPLVWTLQTLRPEWAKLSTRLEGIANVARINASVNGQQDLSSQGYPHIVLIPGAPRIWRSSPSIGLLMPLLFCYRLDFKTHKLTQRSFFWAFSSKLKPFQLIFVPCFLSWWIFWSRTFLELSLQVYWLNLACWALVASFCRERIGA